MVQASEADEAIGWSGFVWMVDAAALECESREFLLILHGIGWFGGCSECTRRESWEQSD
jgi:hypothetical protein